MEDFDDVDEWRAQALRDPAVAAGLLLRLRDAARQQLMDPLSSPPAGREVAPAGWGSRGRRTRASAGMRDVNEKDDAAAAAARASPMTPLDYGGGSGASESGEDQPAAAAAKRSRPGEPAAARYGGRCETKVVGTGERAPLVFSNPDPKPIKRPTKKKTIPELQAMERTLLQQRGMLQKEVEAQRRAHAALVAENRRLKRLKRMPSTAAPIRKEVQDKQLRPCPALAPLPDLNIPIFEELG